MRKFYTTIILIVFTITLHGQNKLLSSINQIYSGSSWINSWGYNYEYDAKNNLISETSLQWENGQWVNQDKTTYTYNDNNKVTEVLYQDWNKVTNQFETPEKEIYTYLNGKVVEMLTVEWENSQWTNEGKYTLFYNVNNLPESGLGYSWDGIQWVNDGRESYTYTNNKLTGDFGETLRNSQWQNDFRGAYVYTNNKMSSFINEDWSNGAWSQSESTVFVVDPTGNRTSKTSDYTYGKWKDENQYDTTSLMSSFAHPFADKTGLDYIFEDFPYVNKILSTDQYNYDVATSKYILSNRTTYNYNSYISLSTENFETNNVVVSVYPNPSKDFIQVSGLTETKKIEVYSILGAKVIVGNTSNNEKIDIQNLTNGIYFLKFDDGNSIKFIKK